MQSQFETRKIEQDVKAVLHKKADAFSRVLIVQAFNKLVISDQLKSIYGQELDMTNEELLKSWKENFPVSYERHVAAVEDQIKEFLLNKESDIDRYRIICLKLDRQYGKPKSKSRKQIFKNVSEFLLKLKSSNIDVLSWIEKNKKVRNFEDIQLNVREYYSVSFGRFKEYFEEDYNIRLSGLRKETDKRRSQLDSGLMGLKDEISNRIIDQQYAVERMAEILINLRRRGEKTNEEPRVFLFCGPTGVGKTELAKILSCHISSSNRRRLAIFNMEKYTQEHDSSNLFGAAQGYVGSLDEPFFSKAVDPLVDQAIGDEKIISNAVLLFDEIEKAHHKVRQTLLTLLDKGEIKLTHTKGGKNIETKYSFYNCIFVCTSNLFSDMIVSCFKENINIAEIAEIFRESSTQYDPVKNPTPFSPEWLGRMTVVPFGPISRGKEFQKVIENSLFEQFEKIKKDHGIITNIDPKDKGGILQAFEDEHYNNGISVRIFKENIQLAFDKVLSKLPLNTDFVSEMEMGFTLKMDQETDRVVLQATIVELGETRIINGNEQDKKLFLTSSPKNLREEKGKSVYGTVHNLFSSPRPRSSETGQDGDYEYNEIAKKDKQNLPKKLGFK